MTDLEKHTLKHVLDMLTIAYSNTLYITKEKFVNEGDWSIYHESRQQYRKTLEDASNWIQSMDIKN